jgi:hypothetical protein
MAILRGHLPAAASRSLLDSFRARISATARQQMELSEGEGLLSLAGLLKGLPDHVSAVIRPTLGFLTVDACVGAPGTLLVLNALHWGGEIALSKKGAWTGKGGKVDLGRPDRRAFAFADRLRFSGRAGGLTLRTAVLLTAGPVKFLAPEPEAELVQHDQAEAWLREATAARPGSDASALLESLLGG